MCVKLKEFPPSSLLKFHFVNIYCLAINYCEKVCWSIFTTSKLLCSKNTCTETPLVLVLGIDTFLRYRYFSIPHFDPKFRYRYFFRYLTTIPILRIDTFGYLTTIPILRIDTFRFLVLIPISGIDT